LRGKSWQFQFIRRSTTVVKQGSKDFAGGTLTCKCTDKPVKVSVGRKFAQPRLWLHQVLEAEGREVFGGRGRIEGQGLGHPERRQAASSIRRHHSAPCMQGVRRHMFGRIENTKHAFYGLDFVHTELSTESGWAAPGSRHSSPRSSRRATIRRTWARFAAA
jgi:S-(hydroxymethyl)glutathione synthase